MTIYNKILTSYPQTYAQTASTIQDKAAQQILVYAGKPGMLNRLKCLNQEERIFLEDFIEDLHQGIDIQQKAAFFYKKICPVLDTEKPKNSLREDLILAIKKLFSKICCSEYIYSHELDTQISYFQRSQVWKDFENPTSYSYTFYD